MAVLLSPNTEKAIDKLFPNENKDEAKALLIEQCGDNLPNCEYENEYDLEDVRFAALKLSEGNITKLKDAVQLANEDWRDLFFEAGSSNRFVRELLGNDYERVKFPRDRLRHALYALAIPAFVSSLIIQLNAASHLILEPVMLALTGICLVLTFMLLWADRHFRENSGVAGAILFSLFMSAIIIALPAILGIVVAIGIEYFI